MLFRRKGRVTEAEREMQARADERRTAIERLKRDAERDAEYLRDADRTKSEGLPRRPEAP